MSRVTIIIIGSHGLMWTCNTKLIVTKHNKLTEHVENPNWQEAVGYVQVQLRRLTQG